MKKIIKKAYKALYILKNKLGKKRIFNKETIVVCKPSWKSFDASLYNSEEYDIAYVESVYGINQNSYDKIVAYIGDVPKGKLKQMVNLKWLQINSHGFNGFEKKVLYADDKVIVTNLHGIFSKPMANYCVSAWYMFNCFALRRVFSPDVKKNNVGQGNDEISVLIYGLGDIGNEIARACKRQGWKVYGVKRSIPEILPDYLEDVVSFKDAEKYISKCDYIINVLPETKDTIGVFDREFFSKMNKNSVFCNVGRGSAVVDKDLDDAVKNSIIKGAILDACSSYPYKNPNIVLTHHYSSFSKENDELTDKLFSAQLKEFIENGESSLENKVPLA